MTKRFIYIFTILLLLAGIIPAVASATLTNLALNKPVITGSGSYCGGSETAAQAVDGNTGTKWCYQPGVDWLRVDLGAIYSVSQFVLTNNGEQAPYKTKDYNILTSIDGSTWSTVVSVTDNTTLVVTSDINPIMARYVKLDIISPTQDGAGVLRINEFAVNGDNTPIVNAETPSIGTTEPMVSNVYKGDSSPMLSVTASVSDSGTLSYQWYENTTDSNNGGSMIGGAASASYVASTNTVGTTYYYVVVTNTNNGVTGNQTAWTTSLVMAVNVNEIPPVSPSNLTVVAGEGQVTLQWSGVTGANNYDIYQGMHSGSYDTPYIDSVSSSTNSYTVTGLDNGSTYYFAIKARNTGGVSDYSNEVSATPFHIEVSSAQMDASGQTVEITFNEPLAVQSIAPEVFLIHVGSRPIAVTQVISGSPGSQTMYLTVNEPLYKWDRISVDIQGGVIQSEYGSKLASITSMKVQNEIMVYSPAFPDSNHIDISNIVAFLNSRNFDVDVDGDGAFNPDDIRMLLQQIQSLNH